MVLAVFGRKDDFVVVCHLLKWTLSFERLFWLFIVKKSKILAPHPNQNGLDEGVAAAQPRGSETSFEVSFSSETWDRRVVELTFALLKGKSCGLVYSRILIGSWAAYGRWVSSFSGQTGFEGVTFSGPWPGYGAGFEIQCLKLTVVLGFGDQKVTFWHFWFYWSK